MNSVMTKTPLDEKGTGSNPADCGKNQMQLVDWQAEDAVGQQPWIAQIGNWVATP